MRRVSEQTGLQVVACTGIYTYDHLPQFFVSRDADQIAELFVADIEQGIQGTDIKAAFIKCAADEPGVTENVEKVHRAAARASVAHRRADHGPLAARRATPARARSRSSSRRASTRRRSRSPTPATPTTSTTSSGCSRRASGSASTATGSRCTCPTSSARRPRSPLLERGYADRLFLSADSCGTIDWFPQEAIEQMLAAGMAKDWDIRIVHQRVIPDLERGRGRRDDQIETIMVRNPVSWLTGA